MALNTAGQTRTGSIPPSDGPKFSCGRVVLAASPALTAADFMLFEVGFTPKYVRFENVTDIGMFEWHEGEVADTCTRTVAAGTRTLQTTNQGITICDAAGNANPDGRCFMVSQNATLAAIVVNKTLKWAAWG